MQHTEACQLAKLRAFFRWRRMCSRHIGSRNTPYIPKTLSLTLLLPISAQGGKETFYRLTFHCISSD